MNPIFTNLVTFITGINVVGIMIPPYTSKGVDILCIFSSFWRASGKICFLVLDLAKSKILCTFEHTDVLHTTDTFIYTKKIDTELCTFFY